MEKTLLALAALASVALGEDPSQTFCHGQPCPYYEISATYPTFEVRSYLATTWIATAIKSSSTIDVTAAYNRLKAYCDNNEAAGEAIHSTWPALIRYTEGKGYFMQWFVPGVSVADDPALSVEVINTTASIIYARIFHGVPSLDSGIENRRLLIADLEVEGKQYDNTTYFGAGYDSLFALEHNNEVWIPAKVN